MDIYCRNTDVGFVPLDDNELDKKRKIPLGADVKVTVSIPRNLNFHRKFFALLTITLDNLPDSISKTRGIKSVEDLLRAIKLDMGWYDIVELEGEKQVLLKSISFAAMDNYGFSKFFDMAIDLIAKKYIVGINRQSLINEVETFTNNKIR